MTLRKLFFYVHLVAGFAAGLLLTSAGLTGSLLVWRPEIDALLHPELLRVEPEGAPLPVERVLQIATATAPAAPSRVQFPRAPQETFEVVTAGAEPLQLYVDPYRGTVLGSRGVEETFGNALFAWHTTLFSGHTGEVLMGIAALLLLVLVVTGVVVWWPGMRRLWDGFRVKWSAGWKRINFDLHRALGIWGTAFLTVVAITGSSLVFHDAYMAVLDRVTASPPRPVPPPATPTGAPRLPADDLVRIADGAIPGGIVTYLILPEEPGGAAIVRKKLPEELHPSGRNFVYLHPETGEVLAVEAALTAPAGTRAYNVLYPIHIGRWGGILSRVLYSLLGLLPAVLFVSGCLMWWNRSGRRRFRPERRARAARPPARRRSPAEVA